MTQRFDNIAIVCILTCTLFVLVTFGISQVRLPKELSGGVMVRMNEIEINQREITNEIIYDISKLRETIYYINLKLKCIQVETDVSMECTDEEIDEYNQYKKEERETHDRYMEMKEINSF